MPRKQDFSQSVVYHIRRIETKEVVYVGSSCNFTQRQRSHKYSCYDEINIVYNYPIYVYIREQGGFDLYEVVPIAFHKLDNKIQLRIEEQKEIDKYPNAFNKCKAYISKTELAQQKKEYYEEKKEHLTQKAKEWREANADRLKEWRETNKQHTLQKSKEWYEANKQHTLQKSKERYDANKEHITQKHKEYYEANKEELSQKAKERYRLKNEKVECPCCKKVITKGYLPRHQKSTACVLAK